MKLSLAIGLVALSAATAASAQHQSLTVRQVGHAPPTGLGNYGNVGAPYPPAFYGRGYGSGFTRIYLGHADYVRNNPAQLPATRPQLRHRGIYGDGYGGYPPYVGGWSSGLIEDPERFRDAAYFAGSADSWHEGGRAYYDYDRGYPYDWYRDNSPRSVEPVSYARVSTDSALRCAVETEGVRVCRGRR